MKLRSKSAAKTDLSPPWVLEVGGPRSVVAGIWSLPAARNGTEAVPYVGRGFDKSFTIDQIPSAAGRRGSFEP
ncbi:MAG: hypothetical protein K9L59_02225, partial [Desulfobacterales bacterium]|nr:hypothetical protein [Desulfobacterales bacterium]